MRARRGGVATRRARCTWFDAWNGELSAAAGTLPEALPGLRDLYASLGDAPQPGCEIGLVTRAGEATAIVLTRRTGRSSWEVRTNWMLPGVVCLAAPHDVLDALRATGRSVRVAWWRMGPAPESSVVHAREDTPVRRLTLEGREAYWRRAKQWQTVTHARRACAELELRVNAPGDTEWITRGWQHRWSVDAGGRLADRLLVGDHLVAHGLGLTLTLADAGGPLAGTTNILHGDTLTAGLLHRDERSGKLPTGVRLIDVACDLAVERGLTTFDLGGGHDYKAKWAPEAGTRSEFTVSPPLQRAVRAGAHRARSAVHDLRTRATRRTSRGSTTARHP